MTGMAVPSPVPARARRALAQLVGLAFRADRSAAAATGLLAMFETLTQVLFAWWLKVIVDASTRGDWGVIVAAAVTYGGSLALLGAANLFRLNLSTVLQEKTGFAIDELLSRASVDVPTLEHHERPEYVDKLTVVRSQRGLLGGGVAAVVASAQSATMLLGSLVLLVSVSPAMLIVPVLAAPSVLTRRRAAALKQRSDQAAAPDRRLARHLFTLATSPGSAKEIRLFDLQEVVTARHGLAWETYEATARRGSLRAALLNAIGATIFSVGYCASIGIVLYQAIRSNSITVGEVVLVIAAARQLSVTLTAAAASGAYLTMAAEGMKNVLWLTDYAEMYAARQPATRRPSARIERSIAFDRVSFSYPGARVPALQDVDICLEAGQTVAIVGENGAGKTTLVKLLCRFYEPTNGRILLDGVPISEYPIAEWRACLAGAFQDAMRFEFRVDEAVGVGDLPRVHSRPQIEWAVARAGAEDVVGSLPDGYETQLGRSYTDGVDLSGGQWQKVAVARASMRRAPLVIVLDEPTASLDVPTESQLFARYAALARDARHDGAITVLVSHRFSTVRFADEIVVLDGGRVREVGSHAALMAVDGLYAEMYELHRRAFR